MSSNRGTQNPNNGTPATTGAPKDPPKEEPKEKMTITQRVLNFKNKVMANKVGHFLVNGAKVLGVGAVGFLGYKAGQKSVKPVTVYIREGVTEEPQDEPKETEPVNDESGEVIEDE